MASPALDYITIKGFKSIKSIERLALRPVNLLIGANGSGKSNFIGAFEFLHAIREGKLREYVARAGGAEQVLHFGSKTTQEVFLGISFEGGQNGYDLTLSTTADDSLFPLKEFTSFWNRREFDGPNHKPLRSQLTSTEAAISNSELAGKHAWVRKRLGGWRVFHVHDTSGSSPMRKTANIEDNDFLRPDGANLASILYFLREKHPDSYAMIRHAIQSIAPFFEDFQMVPRTLNAESIDLRWRHKGSDQYFGASSLSDGTLRFVFLATLFLQPAYRHPSVILVDEPELGLHPAAIAKLAALIQSAAQTTQVVVSTQSSLLLDHFEPSDVLVAERIGEGTQIRRLSSDDYSQWLADYSLGQLWEKNELGGRPH